MFLAMLPDSTTPATIESPTALWCHIGAAYLPTTAKSERYWSLCSSRSISIRLNSPSLADSIICPSDNDGQPQAMKVIPDSWEVKPVSRLYGCGILRQVKENI